MQTSKITPSVAKLNNISLIQALGRGSIDQTTPVYVGSSGGNGNYHFISAAITWILETLKGKPWVLVERCFTIYDLETDFPDLIVTYYDETYIPPHPPTGVDSGNGDVYIISISVGGVPNFHFPYPKVHIVPDLPARVGDIQIALRAVFPTQTEWKDPILVKNKYGVSGLHLPKRGIYGEDGKLREDLYCGHNSE